MNIRRNFIKFKRTIVVLFVVNVIPLMIFAQPVITDQPTNQTIVSGNTISFNVGVSGTGPFTYQWQFNGVNLPNNIITTVAGNGSTTYAGDGVMATNTGLYWVSDVHFDQSGNLYLSERLNNRVRMISTNGIITTVAGNGIQGFSGDGGAATNANFYNPSGLAIDAGGNLYIADFLNSRIREVNTNGIISTVAGGGSGGDGGLATNAGLAFTYGVATDTNGNLFIADQYRGKIRKVDTNGIITTVAGIGPGFGYSGDGGAATNATLNLPPRLTLDTAGDLFISDQSNYRIRKVDTSGIITTIAGNGVAGFSGDGGAAINATLNRPCGVAIDGAGNLFISDQQNSRIREVSTNGIITTIAGNGSFSYSGDGGSATNAGINYPCGLTFDASGNLFIADQYNNRVRKVALAGTPTLTLNNTTTNNAGQYSVIITGADGSVTSSVVSLTVILSPQNFTGSLTDETNLQLHFNGTPGYPYLLQVATNLSQPVVWQTIATNNADINGDWFFVDTNFEQYLQRFYRISP